MKESEICCPVRRGGKGFEKKSNNKFDADYAITFDKTALILRISRIQQSKKAPHFALLSRS